MGHNESIENLSPEEKKYRALMTNGEDFLKIEIYRSALKRFRDAAAMKLDNGEAAEKVEEVSKLLKKENKAIYIIVAVAAVVVALVWIF